MVGAVTLDIHGILAAASSTGGLTYKMPGRIGDTALTGAGLFADQDIATVWAGKSTSPSLEILVASAKSPSSSGSG